MYGCHNIVLTVPIFLPTISLEVSGALPLVGVLNASSNLSLILYVAEEAPPDVGQRVWRKLP